MIIVDSSVWIDHLRAAEPHMDEIVQQQLVRLHPFVLAEIALGNPPYRKKLLGNLSRLLPAPVATVEEMLLLVEREALYGLGLGFVDVHLLASAKLSPGATIWTRDKRLKAVAERLGLAMKLH